MKILVFIALLLVVAKVVWVGCALRGNGSFEREKNDILSRRNYLIDKIVVKPEQLLHEMPEGLEPQFQGEWALYSCSMLSAALANIATIYPETKEESVGHIDSIIAISMSPEIRRYDAERWNEDPLESLDGGQSHISYLSHLAWMIGSYKRAGGTKKYDKLYHSLCSTMNRRILKSPILNLPTYPGENIYIPDMLVAIVALAEYSRWYGGRYASTVDKWLRRVEAEWLDGKTGLIVSFLPAEGGEKPNKLPVKGSYSALSCYYLTYIDRNFAKDQYDKLKDAFVQNVLLTGIKEYSDRLCLLGADVDAGPIIFNLSPTGTAFTVGSATYFEDHALRKRLLKTAEVAGTTVSWKGKRHYLLANVALVGEAIMLAMKTTVPSGGTADTPPPPAKRKGRYAP